jgi:hypothetical protein
MPETTLAHASGRWYFEATVERYEAGWSHVGIYAPPSFVHDMVAALPGTVSAEAFKPTALSTVSVVADLDAGRVYFYVDGVLHEERSMALLPGVGAFHAGAVSMTGNSIRLNYGTEPFTYGVPSGFQAWSSGQSDANGACVSDPDARVQPAPVTVNCEGADECVPTSFEADTHADTDLVVLGVSDAGSDPGWRWADANGQAIRVPTGTARNGSILVEVKRPGRVALVLTAFTPTDWTVHVDPRTQLTRVAAFGMYQQTVGGLAPDVPLEVHTICVDRDCSTQTGETFPVGAYQWPFSTGGGDTQGFVKEVERRFGLPLKLFAGAYEARGFVVR